VAIIEAYLEDRRELRAAPEGEELYLREAASFIVPTGLVAHDPAEFADCMERVGFGALTHPRSIRSATRTASSPRPRCMRSSNACRYRRTNPSSRRCRVSTASKTRLA